jgi:2'-5' RNA ligase
VLIEMDGFCGEGPAANSFSLVAYVPQPLAGFIERIRHEIQPGCTTRSHLTFLPPRTLDIPLDQIRSQLEIGLRNQPPFRVELRDVGVFPISQAVHLTIGAGWAEIIKSHQALHFGDLCCQETFEYHPHVTLAQDLAPEKAVAVAELAKRRWQEYSGNRDFVVDQLTLVQNKLEKGWTNLGEFTLRVPVSV